MATNTRVREDVSIGRHIHQRTYRIEVHAGLQLSGVRIRRHDLHIGNGAGEGHAPLMDGKFRPATAVVRNKKQMHTNCAGNNTRRYWEKR